MVYDDVSEMPFPVAFRLLAFLPVPAIPSGVHRRSGATDERWALLNASPELRETIATGLTLEFIQRLRADLVVTPCGERAWFVSQRPQQDRDATLAALHYMSKESVLPQQLAQQDGATLRQLIAEATRGVPAVWIWAFAGELDWFAKVLKLAAGCDDPLDRRTTCCNRVTVRGDGVTSPVVLRFIPHENVALTCTTGHAECLSALRDRNPQIDAAAVDTLTTSRPADLAAMGGHGECLSVLRSWGVDLTSHNRSGDQCGHIAAQYDRLAILRLLHGWGVDLATPNTAGATPAQLAEARGHTAALAYLREIGRA